MVVRILTVITVVFAVLGALFVYSGIPKEPSSHTPSGKLLEQNIYEVGYLDFQLKDDSRAMPANGDFAGLAWRPLDTAVWYPMVENQQFAPGKHPVVVFAHGYSSGKIGGAYLARFLAAQGYIVVAADFPLTNMDAPDGPNAQDVINQPGDISFLIDTLSRWNEQGSSPFHQRLDLERLAVVGISLGGMTATLATWHPQLSDPRIKATVSIAGVASMFNADFYDDNAVPVMLIASPEDVIVNYEDNAIPMAQSVSGALLVTVVGASHAGFSEFARYMRWLHSPDSISCPAAHKRLARYPINNELVRQLGSPAEGVVDMKPLSPCPSEMPKAINPIVQQWVTQLAVYGFLQAHFGQTATERRHGREYLGQHLGKDFPFVSVTQTP